MLYIAWFVFFFTMLQLLIAFVNLLFFIEIAAGQQK